MKVFYKIMFLSNERKMKMLVIFIIHFFSQENRKVERKEKVNSIKISHEILLQM